MRKAAILILCAVSCAALIATSQGDIGTHQVNEIETVEQSFYLAAGQTTQYTIDLVFTTSASPSHLYKSVQVEALAPYGAARLAASLQTEGGDSGVAEIDPVAAVWIIDQERVINELNITPQGRTVLTLTAEQGDVTGAFTVGAYAEWFAADTGETPTIQITVREVEADTGG